MSDPLSFLESEAARIQFASLALHDPADEDTAFSDSDEEHLPNAMQALPVEDALMKQQLGDELDSYERELRKAIARADGQAVEEEEDEDAEVDETGKPLDGKIWDFIRGKKRTKAEKAAMARRKAKKAEADADYHDETGGSGDSKSPLLTAPLVFNTDILTKEERAFADTVDHIAMRGFGLAQIASELMKLPKTAAFLQATYAAASTLAELRGEAEQQLKAAVLKAGVDRASTQRKTEPKAEDAKRLAGHLAALGPSLAANKADERGKLMAHYLRSTAGSPTLIKTVVAALADVVQLLQNRLSDGKIPKDTESRLATFWATQGKVTDFHACVQQQFA